MTNIQRAFWTFLFFTLAGPFLTGLATFLILPVLVLLQLMPLVDSGWQGVANLDEKGVRSALSLTALTSVKAYIWAATPAALSGLICALLISRGWVAHWAIVGGLGVLGFTIAAILMPFGHDELLTFIAFGAGLIAIACYAALRKAGVLQKAGVLASNHNTSM